MLTVFMAVTKALNYTKHYIPRTTGDIWMKLKSYGIHIKEPPSDIENLAVS
jgi:hypothetical protein